MKKQVLALAIVTSLAAPSVALAAVNYDGTKLSSKYGPTYQPKTQEEAEAAIVKAPATLADVEAAGRNDNQVLTLQDLPNAKTEQQKAALEESKKLKKKKGAKTNAAPVAQSSLPVTIFGDQVIYHQDTGDFEALGKVRIYQGTQKLFTTKAEGNIKTGDVYLQQGGRLIDGPNTTNGKWAHYNFLDKTGTIKNMEGTNGKDIYHSDIGHIYPDRIELTEGASTSRCPAVDHAKCVDVRSNKVIIYPNDKIIAYDVKVYIKGKHIYSRDRWINDLTKSDQNSFMPHLGYTKEHGLEVTYRYNYVFNEKNTATADLVWYKKIGWRPMFYDVQDEKNFYVKLQNGHTEDSNNNWIKKERDLTIGYKSHKFNKKWPLNYSAYASHGFWTGSGYDSWHSETGFFINHDTITFGKVRPLTLNLGTGYKLTHESANSSTTRSMLYSATLGKPFLGGWYSWLGYYWEKDRNNLFAYNMPDMARELQLGINKTFDSRNRLTFITRYDEGKSKIYEYIWRYTYDFCCWRLNFEFRDKKYENKRDWSVGYDLYRW